MVERHIVEGEARVARQGELVRRLERDHPERAEVARRILETLRETLKLGRQHLERERAKIAGRAAPSIS